MFLNVDQLEKQLNKEEFQEIGSMAAFRVLKTQFQQFINSQFSLDDDDGQMTSKYFLKYTRIEDTHNRSGNDADADDADIKPVYDEEPMAKVQLTAECIDFANDQQHAEQPVFKNGGGVDQDAKQCHEKRGNRRVVFKTVGLRWVPTRKIFASSTTTVDCESPHGSNADITNPYECKQTLDVSADPKMCMFALTVSTAEPKNIREVMADHAWIEAMQEKLQFNRLNQAPRAWFDELSTFPISKGFTKDPPIPMSIGTPMATKPKLDVDLSGTPVDQTRYQIMIGSLMYLTSSRPDIVQTYPNNSGFELTAFLDVDNAGCLDTRKSTSRGIQFLGDKLVSWMSKNQDCTIMSTTEAEYVALSESHAQVLWMRIQLKDYGFDYTRVPLYCDSQSAITIS
ncbi:hypothetical protein Tco_0700743 [Tanacetum coccineum]